MADNAKHINYTLADIEQYFAGKLSAEEMHAMEKAALQDPFLADAMEGFAQSDMNIAKEHLSAIEKELLKEKESTKVVAIVKNKFSAFKIAAAIIGIALVSTITYFVLQPKQSNISQSIATVKTDTPIQHKEIQVIKDSVPSTALIASTTPTSKKEEKKIFESKAKQPIALKSENEKASFDISVDTSKLNEVVVIGYGTQKKKDVTGSVVSTSDTVSFNISKESLAGKVAGVQANKQNNDYKISGKVVNANGVPINGASVVVNNKKIGTTTDVNGNFTLTLKDSSANIDIAAIGFEVRNYIATANQNNQISLKENNQSLSEVVVVGMGNAKRKSAMAAPTINNTTDSVSPKKGWDHYKTYLQSSIVELQSSEKDPDNEIEFEFDIDKKGRAQNIQIIKSPSPNINPQLINAIEKGPKWTDQSKQKISRKRAKIKL